MKKILILCAGLFLGMTANAQTPYSLSGTSYVQTFDGLANGLPLGWRVDSMVNKNAGLGNDAQFRFSTAQVAWSNVSRGFKNLASSDGLTAASTSTDQNNSTDRALGARQVSSAGWDDKDSLIDFAFQVANTSGLSAFNLSFKFMSLSISGGRSNQWIVQYGLGANPSTFTTIATSPATINADSTFQNGTFTVNFGTALDNQNQPVWIRITPTDTTIGTGSRPQVAIDDFNLTWTGTAVNNTPQIVSFNPADNTTGLAAGTTNLTVTFDKNIAAGTGNITVYNLTDATNQVIAASATTVSGMVATIPGVNLATSKDYAVQFDSTCFKANGYSSLGVYNNTTWNFSTVTPPPPPMTSLNETFTGCNAPLLGSFMQTSVAGAQTWRCSNFGRNDTDAVYMNGGTATEAFDNTDWLVSAPLDMSAMSTPYFHFWAKRRFVGTVTKEVYVSNNYAGDPLTATWIPLGINLNALDTIWTPFYNANLSAYKSTLFNIGFKYVSTATPTPNAEEWTLDDIYITDGPVGLSTVTMDQASFYVLGNVTDSRLNLMLESAKSDAYQLTVRDMMGHVIYSSQIAVNPGKNKVQASLPSLSQGVYMVDVQNEHAKGVVKFVNQ